MPRLAPKCPSPRFPNPQHHELCRGTAHAFDGAAVWAHADGVRTRAAERAGCQRPASRPRQ
eukprot:12530081-Alexandrium_andersonii.AAC.1